MLARMLNELEDRSYPGSSSHHIEIIVLSFGYFFPESLKMYSKSVIYVRDFPM